MSQGQGARLPGNLLQHMKCWQKFMHFRHKFDRKFFFFKMKQKVPVKQMLSCKKKRFSCVKVVSQTEIFLGKKCLAIEINFLPWSEISCHKKIFRNIKIFPVNGRNLFYSKKGAPGGSSVFGKWDIGSSHI